MSKVLMAVMISLVLSSCSAQDVGYLINSGLEGYSDGVNHQVNLRAGNRTYITPSSQVTCQHKSWFIRVSGKQVYCFTDSSCNTICN